jgi:hypothetical protein
VAEGAKGKHHGDPVGEDAQRGQDTIERWAKAEGANLENEAQRAKQKLRNVDRPQPKKPEPTAIPEHI